jgi:hypothetical protein
MNIRAAEAAVIASGLAYLLALGWAIANTSYDVWGAIVIVPIYGVVGLVFVRWMFKGELAQLVKPMAWGLLLKLAGTLARYWVGFEAYDGGIDAGRYHKFATEAASKVWSGEENIITVLPQGRGTPFTENFTAFIYTLTGPSQLAGFVTFSLLAYVGVAFTVKAAAIAVPGLAAKRYAWLCMLFPSVVYWPSSIGKEATIMLGLGVATYGIAKVLTHGRWVTSIALIAAGLGFVSLVRPHMAGIWAAGALPALIVAFVRRPAATVDGSRRRGPNRFGMVVVLALAAAGFAVLSSVTVGFLTPGEAESGNSDSVSQIFDETTRRTAEGGSNFTPPSVSSPVSWPYASVRTLLRPLPQEARTATQAVAAAEVMALLVLLFIGRRRVANIPRLVVSSPYVTFAVTTIFLTGLAYASFANLGLLTRQKSLIFPLLLLLACLPERPAQPGWMGATNQMNPQAPQPRSSPFRRLPPAGGSMPTAPWAADARRNIDDIWA